MTTSVPITFLFLSAAVCLAPGPSMLFVILQGLSRKKGHIAAAVGGLIAANFIWIFLCALGVGALMQRSQHLFGIMKMIGAAYLIYLGVSELLDRKTPRQIKMSTRPILLKRIFLKGFLTSMSNPKALLFYMAFLPQFVSGRWAYPSEILMLGGCYLMVVFLVMSFYGIMAARLAHKLGDPVFSGLLKKVMGISFVGFGVSLLRYEQA